MMKFVILTHAAAPVLFVMATGGGKSLVYDIHSVMFRDVFLTIAPLLALSAE